MALGPSDEIAMIAPKTSNSTAATITFTASLFKCSCLISALLILGSPTLAQTQSSEAVFWVCPANLASLKKQIESQNQNENFETVVALASKAIAINPKVAMFYAKRAEAYLILNKPDQAMADLTTASKLQPKSGWPLIARGRIYDSQGKDALALADYSHGIALGCLVGYKDQARILERNGQLEKAAMSLTKLMPTMRPLEQIPFLFQRAKIYAKLGKNDLAKADNKLASDLLDKSGGKNADRYNR